MTEYLRFARFIETDDPDEAHDAVEQLYLQHTLHTQSDGLHMRLNSVATRRLSVGFLSYGTETQLVMPATQDSYLVNLTTAGRTWAERRDGVRETTSPDARGLVLSPTQGNEVTWSDNAQQLHLKISRPVLESHLSGLLGAPVTSAVDFSYGLDLTTAAGQGLIRATQFLASELDADQNSSSMQLVREQLASFVITSLLLASKHQYSDALLGGQVRETRAGHLRPILDYIDENVAQLLSPELLAQVGSVSVRTLHTLFQRQFGESPMAYVRRLRLGHVRDELITADPRDVRVSDIATRWGFYHHSRFAEQYRKLFNELPSVTLNR